MRQFQGAKVQAFGGNIPIGTETPTNLPKIMPMAIARNIHRAKKRSRSPSPLKADRCCFGCSSWLMVAAVASGSWSACPVLSLSGPLRGGLGFGSWLLNPFFISSVMLKAGGWSCVVGLKRCGAWCAVVGGGSESSNRRREHDLIRESPRPLRFSRLVLLENLVEPIAASA